MMRPTRANEPNGSLLGSYRIATAHDAKKVHTYLMSNHARAPQEVAKFLVTESKELRDKTDRLVVNNRIRGKFQMAFEVKLFGHETGATVEQMLPALNDQPLIFDKPGSSPTL
jgi:hypothetical protein